MTGKATDLDARHARQHPIENDEIGRIFGQPQLGLVAARHALNDVAFRLQVVADEQRQIGLVLDDENARRGGAGEMGDVLARPVHQRSPPVTIAIVSLPDNSSIHPRLIASNAMTQQRRRPGDTQASSLFQTMATTCRRHARRLT